MAQRTWFITGVSSGFGRQLTEQLLQRGDRVIGTVRDTGKVAELRERYPETYHAELLDVTDTAAIHEVVERSFAQLGRIDVLISNAGYGLFGAAEELSDKQVEHIVATNLVGPIQLIRAALPHLRAQGGGRIIQISSYGGQVAFAGNSLYGSGTLLVMDELVTCDTIKNQTEKPLPIISGALQTRVFLITPWSSCWIAGSLF